MTVDLAFKTLLERHKRGKDFPDIVNALFDAAFLFGVSYNLKIDEELRYELEDVIVGYMDQIRKMIKKEG